MQAKCKMIFGIVEKLAPAGLAMEWDNCGLQVGDPEAEVTGILLALDADLDVCREAAEKNCQLIITHHPLFFKQLKQINLQSSQGELVAALIKNGIALYSAHTNLDSAGGGVNDCLAGLLGLERTSPLKAAGPEGFLKFVVFVPSGHEDRVREAVCRAGAGWIGNYSDCTFQTLGTGTFRPRERTNPFIGKQGELEKVEEIRLETIVPERLAPGVVEAVLEAHPYEEVAYDLYPLKIKNTGAGLGRIGELKHPVTLGQMAAEVKKILGLTHVRAGGDAGGTIARVALCGGSGADLWPLARAAGADVLITGDVGYHPARDMVQSGFSFIDAGHYGSEKVVLPALKEFLEENCRLRELEVRVHITGINGDPYVLY